MRLLTINVSVFLSSLAVFAQGDRGTITGTIADPAGAVIAAAAIESKNSETGAVYQTQSTATGNYTLAQLPAGTYELSVTVPGFKEYTRQGLTGQVAQTCTGDAGRGGGTAWVLPRGREEAAEKDHVRV